MKKYAATTIAFAAAAGIVAGAGGCGSGEAPRQVERYIVTDVDIQNQAVKLGACIVKDVKPTDVDLGTADRATPYHYQVRTGLVDKGWADGSSLAVAMQMNGQGQFNIASFVSDPITTEELRQAVLTDDRSKPEGEIYDGILPQARGDIACGQVVSTDGLDITLSSTNPDGTGDIREATVSELPGQIVDVRTFDNGQIGLNIIAR